MARVFIIEDNEDHMFLLETKLNMLGHTVVGKTYNSKDVITKIKLKKPEIILLDINLDGDDAGIALADCIKQIFDVSIIFTTALSANDIVKKAVETDPAGYLVKPIDINELKANIELALYKRKNYQNPKNQSKVEEDRDSKLHLTVRVGYKLEKVNYNQILFLERNSKNYIKIITQGNKKFLIRSSLRSLLNEVLPGGFIQIHRQYVVNLEFIRFVNEREKILYLASDYHLPIGKTYKSALYEKLNLI